PQVWPANQISPPVNNPATRPSTSIAASPDGTFSAKSLRAMSAARARPPRAATLVWARRTISPALRCAQHFALLWQKLAVGRLIRVFSDALGGRQVVARVRRAYRRARRHERPCILDARVPGSVRVFAGFSRRRFRKIALEESSVNWIGR